MFRAYIDDSGKGSKDLFVLAGYIATEAAWAKFSHEWQRIIVGSGPPHYRKLDYFKMSEMQSDADRERCAWFYRLIEEHVTAAISCVIVVPDLVTTVRSFKWPPQLYNIHKLENPYFFAFKATMNVLQQHQAKFGINAPIDFIFDEDTEKAACLEAWDYLKLGVPPGIRDLMGNPPTYQNDLTIMPLQAADMWAWWVRYWELNGIDDGIEKLRFPWRTTRDLPRISFKFSGDDFRKNFEAAYTSQGLAIASFEPDEVRKALKEIEWPKHRGPRE